MVYHENKNVEEEEEKEEEENGEGEEEDDDDDDDDGYSCPRCRIYHRSKDPGCPKLHCSLCDKTGHLDAGCPWSLEGVPPGTEEKPHFRIYCQCCNERICYLESVLQGENPTGIADFKQCGRCGDMGDHETLMCPSMVKEQLYRDANFDPRRHNSFYLENLPAGATELDLFAHFHNKDQYMEDVLVHPDNNTGKNLGLLVYNNPLDAADAFNWGNGVGAMFGHNGDKIKCHPSKSPSLRPSAVLRATVTL